jgi:hypothetical protein
MMEQPAIKTAVALLHVPASIKHVRSEPVPLDIEVILKIAAGDDEEAALAAQLLNRPLDVIRSAAVFYIEQVLLTPGADSYRVLGARLDTPTHQLRRNMALLISWLHPDRNPGSDRSSMTARVTGAWNDLSSDERRRSYDAVFGQRPETIAAAPVPMTAGRVNRQGQRDVCIDQPAKGFFGRLRQLIREGRSRPRTL